MSMISSQVGELRFMAHMLDTDGHPSFAREVRRAADTIWELRNKLAGTVDQSERIDALEEENAKLKKERDYLLANESPTACEVRRVRSAMKDVNDENAKLRKAAGDAWSLFVRFGAVHPYNLPEVDRVRESLQELGIEVD